MQTHKTHKGFTLIELLIVVAIIAILAAIAVPNFLEAQVRAKIARVKSDLRTVSMAIESYVIDHNKPPHAQAMVGRGQYSRNGINVVVNLSTPVAYLTTVNQFLDPFCKTKYYDPEFGDIPDDPSAGYSGQDRTVHMTYMNIYGWGQGWGGEGKREEEANAHWAKFVLISLGPDYIKGPNPKGGYWYVGDYGKAKTVGIPNGRFVPWDYDPTNGTTSGGDILRWSN